MYTPFARKPLLYKVPPLPCNTAHSSRVRCTHRHAAMLPRCSSRPTTARSRPSILTTFSFLLTQSTRETNSFWTRLCARFARRQRLRSKRGAVAIVWRKTAQSSDLVKFAPSAKAGSRRTCDRTRFDSSTMSLTFVMIVRGGIEAQQGHSRRGRSPSSVE